MRKEVTTNPDMGRGGTVSNVITSEDAPLRPKRIAITGFSQMMLAILVYGKEKACDFCGAILGREYFRVLLEPGLSVAKHPTV